jgi:hypothetical protein
MPGGYQNIPFAGVSALLVAHRQVQIVKIFGMSASEL